MEEYKKFALIEFLIYSIVSSYALLSQYFAEVGFSSSQIGILNLNRDVHLKNFEQ